MLDALVAGAQEHPLRLWAHGDLPAATRLASQYGFERFRALWQMHRPLDAPADESVLPPGRVLRTFVPGQDEDEWLALNGRAFAKHPEQGAWTRHDLDLREREPWFDPAGFFIVTHDGVMTGFHWTKVHPAGEQDGGGQEEPVGEVYVVGVDPAEQGSGLGRALTQVGLRHLRDLGLTQVMLYVDEDNTPAIRMYQRLGFERTRIDAMYRRPPGGAAAALAAVYPERLIELCGGERPVRRRDRAQHLGVELDLIEGDAVVNTQVQLPGNRAHLRR